MTENNGRLFDPHFMDDIGHSIKSGMHLTGANVCALRAMEQSPLMQALGGSGMVVCVSKSVWDVRRYFKAKNTIERELLNMYEKLFEEASQLKECPPRVQEALKAYQIRRAAYRQARSVGKSIRSTDFKMLDSQLKNAGSRLFREIHSAKPAGISQDLLTRTHTIKKAMSGNGGVNISKLLNTPEGEKLFNDLKRLGYFKKVDVAKSGNIIAKAAKQSRFNRFLRAGGKSFILFVLAYDLYTFGQPNAAKIDHEVIEKMEELYKSTIDTVETVPDKYDYEVLPEERADLVHWAIDHTQDLEEKEMLIELSERYEYDVYEYLKDKKYIRPEYVADGELSRTVMEEMERRLSDNANGKFYAQLQRVKEQDRWFDKCHDECKDVCQINEEMPTVSQILKDASCSDSVTILDRIGMNLETFPYPQVAALKEVLHETSHKAQSMSDNVRELISECELPKYGDNSR